MHDKRSHRVAPPKWGKDDDIHHHDSTRPLRLADLPSSIMRDGRLCVTVGPGPDEVVGAAPPNRTMWGANFVSDVCRVPHVLTLSWVIFSCFFFLLRPARGRRERKTNRSGRP